MSVQNLTEIEFLFGYARQRHRKHRSVAWSKKLTKRYTASRMLTHKVTHNRFLVCVSAGCPSTETAVAAPSVQSDDELLPSKSLTQTHWHDRRVDTCDGSRMQVPCMQSTVAVRFCSVSLWRNWHFLRSVILRGLGLTCRCKGCTGWDYCDIVSLRLHQRSCRNDDITFLLAFSCILIK